MSFTRTKTQLRRFDDGLAHVALGYAVGVDATNSKGVLWLKSCGGYAYASTYVPAFPTCLRCMAINAGSILYSGDTLTITYTITI